MHRPDPSGSFVLADGPRNPGESGAVRELETVIKVDWPCD